MKYLHALVVVLILVVPAMAQKSGAFPSGRIVDLTYAFDASTVENTSGAESFRPATKNSPLPRTSRPIQRPIAVRATE